jgi:cell division protein FtsB
MRVEAQISDIIGMEKGTPNSTPASSASVTGGESKPANRAADVSKTLASLPIDIGKIADPIVKQALTALLNLVERQAREIAALREQNQQLRDENNRLKGEQGKPDVKANKTSGNISSEKERRSREPNCTRERGTKLDKITIHRTTVCPIDRKKLPDDAVFKGYQSVIVQELEITPANIEFKRETYYSPSQNKTYAGVLPAGYEGEFGPGIRSLALSLKYVCNMSEPKILEFFQEHDVMISAATISRMLTHGLEPFHQEKADLYAAALESSAHHQIDDTSARVRGQNHHTQIMCNELYAAYFTTERKDRLTILDVLRQFESRMFLFNTESARLLEVMGVPEPVRRKLAGVTKGVRLTEAALEILLNGVFPDAERNALHRTRIKEATAIAAYHQQTGHPVVKILLCDDAPQFKLLTEELGLCWVHDGRHYKKLCPVVPQHAQWLQTFLERYWDFYAKLLAFKTTPSGALAATLSAEFDHLFATETGYEDLDERIAKTRAKKEMLLLVLRHPELPLHNNACELEARVAARRRDVSLHTMTAAGTRACDTMTSIVRTAKKLGLSAFKFIQDRVNQSFQITSLAELIRARAANRSTEPCAGT